MKKMRKIIIASLVFMMCLVQGVSIFAGTPYRTFTLDSYGSYVETQTAYTPIGSLTKVGDLEFSGANDVIVSKRGQIYICDTGNKRIIVSNQEGNLIRIIGEGILGTPLGIFLTDEEELYVADEQMEKVFVFDQYGELVGEYGKPVHPLYGESNPYKPQKVVVDKRGNIYVISKGNANGIIQISPAEGGTFLGYFGVNDARMDLVEAFKDLIFTEEQKSQLKRKEPAAASNLTIDEKGLVYTITQGDNMNTVKKLNMAGKNILGDVAYDTYPSDIIVGPIDNIFVASKDGYVYEYTSEGTLLFAFGGRDNGDQRVGLFKSVSAITVDQEGKIYVLDQEKNEIQIFEPTEFTNLVHEALVLYEKGYYLESKGPWEKVIEMNSLFDFAYRGVGEAYYKEENYEMALGSYQQGKAYSGYSDAFWEIRNIWLREHLVSIFIILIVLIVLYQIIKRINKRTGFLKPIKRALDKIGSKKLIKELNFLWYFIKHPLDGYYGIKRERKVSVLSTTILVGLFAVINIVGKYGSGFLFKTVEEGKFDIVTDLMYLFGVMAIVIVCNYLVSTVTEGEGKFRDVYSGFVYALMPVFLIKPICIILSNVLTYNEAFIIELATFIMIAWAAILIVLMIKEIHDYKLRDVFKNIFFTIFTIFIVAVVAFILYILLAQVVEFVLSIVGEVVYKLAN